MRTILQAIILFLVIIYLNNLCGAAVTKQKEGVQTLSQTMITDGVTFTKIKKELSSGNLIAYVLKLDLNKVTLSPSLPAKAEVDFFTSLINFFNPWYNPEISDKHFCIDTVQNMVQKNHALAGINGTFFAKGGPPLGALIINGGIISYSLYDRTAFFIDEEPCPYIDNIFMQSFFKVDGQQRFKVDSVNQGRDTGEIIIYTPSWGGTTGTNLSGIEFVVENSQVIEIGDGNTKIPPTGYVISASGKAANKLKEKVVLGSTIESQFITVPYNASPKKIIHLVSGGPRLLKCGRIYVSKHEENFKADVAKKRAARTAIGINKKGEVLLVAVKAPSALPKKTYKRSKRRSTASKQASTGATLEELSRLFINLGATDAMNLDGGSSTTMVVNNRIVCGVQRKVSNALLVIPK